MNSTCGGIGASDWAAATKLINTSKITATTVVMKCVNCILLFLDKWKDERITIADHVLDEDVSFGSASDSTAQGAVEGAATEQTSAACIAKPSSTNANTADQKALVSRRLVLVSVGSEFAHGGVG